MNTCNNINNNLYIIIIKVILANQSGDRAQELVSTFPSGASEI